MKKFLSLVLAMAMVLSLFTMTTVASAQDFTDDSSITYNEAIDVITAIGVVDGYTDGSFKPQETLTRGAAAKIITNMILGPSTASALTATTAPFRDVPANHTFAAYIAYCAQNGIISGYGDGTFAPGGTLTGYAFLKMLLGALGYDSTIEHFTGANWSINVAKLADGIGLTNDLVDGFSGTAAVNREVACLFAFNTLKADLVEYDSKVTANVNGTEVVVGGTGKAHSVTTNTQATAQNNWNIVNEGNQLNDQGAGYMYNAIVQFGERYFPRLVRNDGKFYWNASYDTNANTDDLGRPANTWVYKGENIGTYVETPDVTYNGSVKIYEIYNDLGMSTATSDVGTAYVNYPNGVGRLLINGIPYAYYDQGSGSASRNVDGLIKVSRSGGIATTSLADLSEGYDYYVDRYVTQKAQSNWTDSGDKKIGDGTIVEVYHNAYTNDVNICAISVYGGKITTARGATNTRDDYVEFDYGGSSNNNPSGINSTKAYFEVTGYAEDDVVAYTYSDKTNSVQSMYKMESVEGSLTERVVTKSLQLGETVYKYAKEYTFETGLTESTLEYGNEYTVYLDSNGYALWTEENDFSVDAYGVIQRISSEVNDTKTNASNPIYGVSQVRRGAVMENAAGGYSGSFGSTTQGSSIAGGSIWDGNRARILFADGTERTVDLDKSYAAPIKNSTAASIFTSIDAVEKDNSAPADVDPLNGQTKIDADGANWTLSIKAGEVVKTRVDKNGNYRLYKLDYNTTGNHWERAVDSFSISNKSMSNGWTGDSKTVFIVKIGNDWKVYTGIRNAPTVQPGGTAYAYITGGTARIVFITEGTVLNTSKDVTFLALQSVSKTHTTNDLVDYYVYNAVVRGEVTTVVIKSNASQSLFSGWESVGATTAGTGPDSQFSFILGKASNGTPKTEYWGAVYNTDVPDADGFVTSFSYSSAATTVRPYVAYGNGRLANGEIRLNTATTSPSVYQVAAGVQIFNVTKGGEITKVTDAVNEVFSSRDTVVLYTMDDGEITNLFIVDTNNHD